MSSWGAHWALFRKKQILRGRNGVYMTRWRLLSTPWFGIFLHRFDGPDEYPTLHDHPWSLVSLVLKGGYEEYTSYEDTRLVRHLNLKRATDFHWIDRLFRVPTWTLILHGPRRRVWGFKDRDGTWTRYDEHPSLMQLSPPVNGPQL